MPVNLQALGDENALGFSLSFIPYALTYTGANFASGNCQVAQVGFSSLAFAHSLHFAAFAASCRQ
jgi:hypothetical protein